MQSRSFYHGRTILTNQMVKSKDCTVLLPHITVLVIIEEQNREPRLLLIPVTLVMAFGCEVCSL